MKYLLIILLFTSCTGKLFVYESKTMLPEDTPIILKKENEAKRVQNRIAKHCSEPRRYGRVLYLNKNQLECKRKTIFGERGMIREKYRGQINAKYDVKGIEELLRE